MAVWPTGADTLVMAETSTAHTMPARILAVLSAGIQRGRVVLARVRIWQWAVLYAAFIVAIILLADTQRRLWLIGRIYDIPFGDKVAHFTLYGILALLINLSAFGARPGKSPVRTAVFCSSVLVTLIALEELSQLWLPLRHASWTDLASSLLGVAVFTWLAVRL